VTNRVNPWGEGEHASTMYILRMDWRFQTHHLAGFCLCASLDRECEVQVFICILQKALMGGSGFFCSKYFGMVVESGNDCSEFM
jgi:hypothetical protein